MIMIMTDDVLEKKRSLSRLQKCHLKIVEKLSFFTFLGQNVKFLSNLFVFENGLDMMF